MTSKALAFEICRLCRRYDFLQTTTIGQSVLGRPLWQLSIGQGPRRVGFNAAHHANEYITAPLLLQFLEEFAAGVCKEDPLYTTLYEQCTLDIVPMVNPDGVDLVLGAIEPSAKVKDIAVRFSNIPFPSGWKANIQGIDLNLTYPAQWQRAKKTKQSLGFCQPAPRDYPGESPLSAPESLALYKQTLAASYQLVIAFHSQGRLIFWDFDGHAPQGALALAKHMSERSGYNVERPLAESAVAGYKDWFIQQFDRPGFTIEVGYGKNPLPLNQFDQIYCEAREIMLSGLRGQ